MWLFLQIWFVDYKILLQSLLKWHQTRWVFTVLKLAIAVINNDDPFSTSMSRTSISLFKLVILYMKNSRKLKPWKRWTYMKSKLFWILENWNECPKSKLHHILPHYRLYVSELWSLYNCWVGCIFGFDYIEIVKTLTPYYFSFAPASCYTITNRTI